ncbi:uncharacterized protein LOC121641437 [Melanotaenia boesemani]|uniref:uncharacterized protein LOC121641437 n=1 Tax=Melanotaenia boesemani TaxID=1250792 RepID=UPI001C03D3AE|nr:uncharacterized protein LOC121641437 [Melanotaenia boesemani]
MFKGCDYKSNIYSTFKSHKSRKHSSHSLVDFKEDVVQVSFVTETEEPDVSNFEESYGDDQPDVLDRSNGQEHLVQLKLAAVLLKLENIFHVPSTAIDELLEELQFLLSTTSLCSTAKIIQETLSSHSLQIEQSVIKELASLLCTSNPVYKSIGKGCPLATSFRHKTFYKDNFKVVEPIEYILDKKDKRTFQYIPVLKVLQQLFILNKVLDYSLISEQREDEVIYSSFRHGLFFKKNCFLTAGELRVFLNLYIDDFEICNPLGTSRKKHKICAVYWNLSNLPPGCHSSLSSIYFTLLCKSEDVRSYGYEKILQPLLRDAVTLENEGIFIAQLGEPASHLPSVRIVKVWPAGTDSALQDRFQHTDWSMFALQVTGDSHADIDTYTSSILDYITTTIDSISTKKQITTYPNQKPWMNKEVWLLLKARNTAFRSGDAQAYSTSRANLRRGIKKAKYSTDVYTALSRISPRKAAGPDGIHGRVLRACVEQLAGIFTDIFNLSLAQAVVPTCFKTTSIVLVLKHFNPVCLNDYRPVTLTSIIMKGFERLVLAHLKNSLPPTLDPHQFA